MLAKICMGGLGHGVCSDAEVNHGPAFRSGPITQPSMRGIPVCGSGDQSGEVFAMGSGLRANAGRTELFELGAEDATRRARAFEGRTLPNDDVAGGWSKGRRPADADDRHCPDGRPRRVQIVARYEETGLHRGDGGFDNQAVSGAWDGKSAHNRRDIRAIGRTNDCICGRPARFTVNASDDELEALWNTSCVHRRTGTPFYEIFKRYDNDFYRIDPMLFSPAEVWLTARRPDGRSTPGMSRLISCARRSPDCHEGRHPMRALAGTDDLCRATKRHLPAWSSMKPGAAWALRDQRWAVERRCGAV
jgi:methenyltetrahydromethanopterin cyclohydrolase